MLIVYIFECASCITSYTHRDYVSQAGARTLSGRDEGGMASLELKGSREGGPPSLASCSSLSPPPQMVSNPSLITKQMLTFYSADSNQGQELTRLWDRVMIEVGWAL